MRLVSSRVETYTVLRITGLFTINQCKKQTDSECRFYYHQMRISSSLLLLFVVVIFFSNA